MIPINVRLLPFDYLSKMLIKSTMSLARKSGPIFTPSVRDRAAPCGHCADCFFRCAMSDRARRIVADSRVIRSWNKGDYLMHAGDEPHGFWAVCRGRVKIFQETESGKYLTLRIAGPGDLVGHRSVLANHAYWGSAVALESTVSSYLSAATLQRLINEDSRVRDEIIRRLASEMGYAESLATTMAYRGSEQRVLGAFRRLAGHARSFDTVSKGALDIEAPRQELAELAGMTVEATVRTLRRLEAAGLVQAHGRRVLIHDTRCLDEDFNFGEISGR